MKYFCSYIYHKCTDDQMISIQIHAHERNIYCKLYIIYFTTFVAVTVPDTCIKKIIKKTHLPQETC